MTDTNKSDVQVMKVDKRGRVRTPAKRRESLLEEFDRSGLSGRQFTELAGIKYQTFATWLQKRKRQDKPASKPADTVRWLEAVVGQAGSPDDKNALVVILPGVNGSVLDSDILRRRVSVSGWRASSEWNILGRCIT